MKEVNCIGKFAVKTMTTGGERAKTICWVFDNGIVDINQLILSKNKRITGYKKLYTKFGASIFVKAYSFKYGTLMTVYKVASEVLRENNVKSDDILI